MSSLAALRILAVLTVAAGVAAAIGERSVAGALAFAAYGPGLLLLAYRRSVERSCELGETISDEDYRRVCRRALVYGAVCGTPFFVATPAFVIGAAAFLWSPPIDWILGLAAVGCMAIVAVCVSIPHFTAYALTKRMLPGSPFRARFLGTARELKVSLHAYAGALVGSGVATLVLSWIFRDA